MNKRTHKLRDYARRSFAGLNAVHASFVTRSAHQMDGSWLLATSGGMELKFDLSKAERVFVVGGGKPTAAMALAVEQIIAHRITDGVISIREGFSVPLQKARIIEASHPPPTNAALLRLGISRISSARRVNAI